VWSGSRKSSSYYHPVPVGIDCISERTDAFLDHAAILRHDLSLRLGMSTKTLESAYPGVFKLENVLARNYDCADIRQYPPADGKYPRAYVKRATICSKIAEDISRLLLEEPPHNGRVSERVKKSKTGAELCH
jgi:hypothetical protein